MSSSQTTHLQQQIAQAIAAGQLELAKSLIALQEKHGR
jgi:hypothetical protein